MGCELLATILILSLPSPMDPSAMNVFCPPWPAPTGPTVTVSTEADLRWQATNAAAGTTIMVSPGVYDLGDIVHIVNQGMTVRGTSGDRDDVILDAGGMLTGHTHAVLIEADDVTIADLTIRNAGEHGVSINARDRATLYNLHILDTGYQLVKVNPPVASDFRGLDSEAVAGSEDGLLSCSRLEYTTTAPENYTNGISAHDAHRWVVRDNEWIRIRTPDNVPAPTILFWSGSSDTIVERNVLVNNYQGIAFGNASHGPGDHSGGIVRNNWIFASALHDTVIDMVHANGWLVAHNTALLLNPDGVSWGMEARYSDSSGTFAYNLTNMDIWVDRDGAAGTNIGNVTGATGDWFIDPFSDLHLLPTATGAIDLATALTDVPSDIDGDLRPAGLAPDVGADEYSLRPPAAVCDLRISRAITAGNAITATLFWTPADGAVTTTLRCSSTGINHSTWPSVTGLIDDLPGDTTIFTTTCTRSGPRWFFALKSSNETGESAVSNNAFWPHSEMYLPIHVRTE